MYMYQNTCVIVHDNMHIYVTTKKGQTRGTMGN